MKTITAILVLASVLWSSQTYAADCAFTSPSLQSGATDGNVLTAAEWNNTMGGIINCIHDRLDSDGGTLLGDLKLGIDTTIPADGTADEIRFTIDETTGNIVTVSGGKFYFDGDVTGAGGDTYLQEIAADVIAFFVGATERLRIAVDKAVFGVDIEVFDGTTTTAKITKTGVATFTSATITDGALAVNSGSITSDDTTLTINAAGMVDIQDDVTVDKLTVDTGNLTMSGGNIVMTGAETVDGVDVGNLPDQIADKLSRTDGGTVNGLITMNNNIDLNAGRLVDGVDLNLHNHSGNGVSGMGVKVDHGNLLGTGDDDHPQYLLQDGSEAMSGPLQIVSGLGVKVKIDEFGKAVFGTDTLPTGAVFRIHRPDPEPANPNPTTPVTAFITTGETDGNSMLRLTEKMETDPFAGGYLLHDGSKGLFHIGTSEPLVGGGHQDTNQISILRDGAVGIGLSLLGEDPNVETMVSVLGPNRGLRVRTNNRDYEAIVAEARDSVEYRGDVVTINVKAPFNPSPATPANAYNFLKAYVGTGDAEVGNADPNTDVKFVVRGNGDILTEGQLLPQELGDFAEYFCGTVGDVTIPIGTTVVLEGEKIRQAALGEQPVGAVRPKDASAIIADAGWNNSDVKYLRDDYGAPIYEDAQFVTWTETSEDENHLVRKEVRTYRVALLPPDVSVPGDAEYFTQTAQKLNPNYDPNAPFVPKEERSDCYVIGLVGKVPITKGQPVADHWVKMKDVSDTVELWLVK